MYKTISENHFKLSLESILLFVSEENASCLTQRNTANILQVTQFLLW